MDRDEDRQPNIFELIAEILIGASVVIGYIIYHVILFIVDICMLLLPFVVVIVVTVLVVIFILIQFGVL